MFQQLERSHDFSYIVIFLRLLCYLVKIFTSHQKFFHPYKPYHAYSAYISDDIFDFYSLRLLNREIASANRNALFLYQEQLEADLSQIETSMAQDWAQNWNYQKLKYKLDPLDVHLNTLSIVNKAREQLALTECLGAVYIYSAPNDVCRCAYQDCYSYEELITMQNYVKSLILNQLPNPGFTIKSVINTFGSPSRFFQCLQCFSSRF